MALLKHLLASLTVAACASIGTSAHAGDAPPNLIAIDAKLTTAGQPSAEWLGTLAAQGFEAVIYLAPPTVPDAVRDEALIVGRQGLTFVNIPIRFDKPADADYETFARTLTALRGKKVLVHCQVNMRASTLTFLYRTLIEKVEPQKAWEPVAKVWTPGGPWKSLMLERLRKEGVAFDPF